MTDAERRLWYYLRDCRLQGWKFRRQVPLGTYIVGFLCEEARLIVELLHTLRLRGGGIGLFTGCAAGDTGAAVVVRVED